MSNSDYYIVWIPGPPTASRANVRAEASLQHRHIPEGQETARVFDVDGKPHGVVELAPGSDAPAPPLQVVEGQMTAAECRAWIQTHVMPDEEVSG